MLLSWNQLRGPNFRRIFPDVYVPDGLVVDLEVRSRAAYLLTLDALARRGRFPPAELLTSDRLVPAREAAGGWTRSSHSPTLARSPPETRLRLPLLRAGLPAPEVQYQIRDEYDFVLTRVDLANPGAKLAIEYDGSTHYTRNVESSTASGTPRWPAMVGKRCGSGATTSEQPRPPGACGTSSRPEGLVAEPESEQRRSVEPNTMVV